jgi:RNA polymerase sigma-70 factor, ECF subfamily
VSDRQTEFVRLLKQHDRRVAAYLFSLVPSWDDAQDLLQDTCVRLWEQFDEYRAEEDFGAWACTIARYLVLAYRKRTQREKLHFRSDVIDALDKQVARDGVENETRLRILAECVKKLSEFARDLLNRCYAGNKKIKDVAEQVGLSVNGTYLTLSRLRRELHDCVEAGIRKEGEL